MSTTTPFRELPGRAKGVLPAWELRKDKEEVTYTLKSCRGLPQNCVHDVSACCKSYRGLLLYDNSDLSDLVPAVVESVGGDRKRRCARHSLERTKGVTAVYTTAQVVQD